MNSLSSLCLIIVTTFTFTGKEDANKFEDVEAKFEAHFHPRNTEVIDSYKFQARNQVPGETLEQFITDLKNMVKRCNYGDQTDRMVRNKIVFGVSDTRLKERLLREQALTLVLAVTLCNAAETTSNNLLIMQNKTEEKLEINALKSRFRSHHDKSAEKNEPKERKQFDCTKCGTKHLGGQCPAFGCTCLNCGKPNHYAKLCRTKPNKIQQIYEEDASQLVESNEAKSLFLGAVQQKGHTRKLVTVEINGQSITMKADTGADVNVLSLKTVMKLGLMAATTKEGPDLYGVSDEKIEHLRRVRIKCFYKQKPHHYSERKPV
uniref:CCHC-type domain-containing protein n=1 Tax=Strigamia maritima TaxID=126957 RepID=T1IMC2_STRMM